jgi:hypothetical protein
MRKTWLAATAPAFAFLATVCANAETVRLPETGDPAFVADLPVGWTHKVDDSGNLILMSPDHTSGMSLSVAAYPGSLDELAAEAMKVAGAADPPQNRGPTQISGYRGYIYDTGQTNPAGVRTNVHMVVVKLDAGHIASATLITAASDNAVQYAAGKQVFDALTLTRKSP